jgi:hypothetical protein
MALIALAYIPDPQLNDTVDTFLKNSLSMNYTEHGL